MGLRDVIAKGINSAFAAVGDIPLDASVRHYSGAKIRDMETGLYSCIFTDTAAKVISVELSKDEGQGNTVDATRKLLIRASEIPVVSIGDVIITAEATYEALTESSDPTNQLHKVFVRESAQKISLAVGTTLVEPRIFNGHGSPSGVVGAVAGDYYLDLDSGTLYEFS